MDSIRLGSLLRIQSNKSVWLEAKSRYYIRLQNYAYIDYDKVHLVWYRDFVLESRGHLELEIGIGAAGGVWKLQLGEVGRTAKFLTPLHPLSYPSFSLTPVEYYCNEPFTLPNWVNSGNNDAQKLCKQFERNAAPAKWCWWWWWRWR